ncbi:MAG TPA: glycosyltransferase [Phycisphaerae bacterium]|nr:glycosyltransferase [Phycisphaerae bacterium]
MKIFMLGWEFPPFISGGLGTACYGLTKALNQLGHEVIFVLPQVVQRPETTHVQLKTPTASQMSAATQATFEQLGYQTYHLSGMENVELRAIPAGLSPYARPEEYGSASQPGTSDGTWSQQSGSGASGGTAGAAQAGASSANTPTSILGGSQPAKSGGDAYGGDMFAEVQRYAKIAMQMAIGEQFEVIHAHDWMTYPAGMAVAAVTGKPLVVHVHSTEFDRSGEHVNQRIYEIERQGMHAARRVVSVSYLTRNLILRHYGVTPEKIDVVYNAIDFNGEGAPLPPPVSRDEKIVLFLGRITMQKGPEYFLAAAKKVLGVEPNVRFIMAGSGDLIRKSIEMAAAMGIGHKVLFTGFLRGDDVARVYRMADLYVMPSVSEPFGIAPLEALANDTPVLISKQSGVSEILKNALKVDFWDIDEMANKIVAVLRHPPLQAALREHGNFEVRRLTWRDCAQGCVDSYRRAIAEH